MPIRTRETDAANAAAELVRSDLPSLVRGIATLTQRVDEHDAYLAGEPSALGAVHAREARAVVVEALALLRGLPVLTLLFADPEGDADAEWLDDARRVLATLDVGLVARLAANAGALGHTAGREVTRRIADRGRER